MNIDQRIERLVNSITEISPKKEEPTTIVMNPIGFSKWYYWCEEQGIDFRMWRDKPIVIDEDGVATIAVNYQ